MVSLLENFSSCYTVCFNTDVQILALKMAVRNIYTYTHMYILYIPSSHIYLTTMRRKIWRGAVIG